jgi:PAS domain S-box-containing protein
MARPRRRLLKRTCELARLRQAEAELQGVKEELRESQRVLATLLGNLPGMAYRGKNDREWTMEFVSDGALSLTGYGPDGLIWNRKSSYGELIHPEDREGVWEAVQSAIRDKQPFDIVYRITTACGGEKWVNEKGTGVFNAEGTLCGLEGFIFDITAGKRTEEQLSMLLESLPIVPYICKATGNYAITYVASSIEEVTGFTPEQFLSDPSFWFDHIHQEDRKRVFTELRKLSKDCDNHSEYRLRTKDGEYRWFGDMRRLVCLPDGKVSHVAGTWQDITEAKRLRQESEHRLQQVIQADKLASLGKVVAGVAHEINNPNSFISYNVPIMEETWRLLEPVLMEYSSERQAWQANGLGMGELCQDMEEVIDAIKIGSDRINKVVTDLKDFVRQENGLCEAPLQINAVVEKTLIIVGAQLRKSIGHMDLQLADGLPEVWGSFQKLEQVVANLLVNSAQAMRDRENGRLLVTTRYLERLECILLEIEDNGVGMPTGVMKHIFEPFFTTRRNVGGTGLGLSVSYDLIRAHGGSISVLSRPGVGTRFGVYLPRNPGARSNLRPSVLVLDDDVDYLNRIKIDLHNIEVLPFEARIDLEVVTKFLMERPEIDIVLTKNMIPEESTIELIGRLRKQFPLMTFVLYGENISVTREDVCGEGMPNYILRAPFSVRNLTDLLDSIERQIL